MMPAGPGHVRLRIMFSGHVQGVGFRYTASRIAAEYPVTGYVRNLPDGRVEVVAEGRRAELDAFVASIGQNMGSHIVEVRVAEEGATGEFDRFEVRY